MYMYLARSKMSADAAHDVGGPQKWVDLVASGGTNAF